MFTPKQNLKRDPEKRWKQTDRVFFGFGACHILAGVYLTETSDRTVYAERIIPNDGFPGNHFFVTNGVLAFDYRGYSCRDNLVTRYMDWHKMRYPGWRGTVEIVSFPLLETAELNQRKHLGPDQYFGDPIPRARRFIAAQRAPDCAQNH